MLVNFGNFGNCWEPIMRHIDANRRLELSLRCPDLQHIEKRLPFKIRHLHLQTSQLQLNDCQYKIGVVRHYTRGEVPDWVQEENRDGGAPCDVEERFEPYSYVIQQRKERDRRTCITYAEVQTTKDKLLTAEKLLRRRLMFAQTRQGYARNEEIKKEITSLKLKLGAQEQLLAVSPLYSHYLQITRIPINQEATRYSRVVLGRAVYGEPISAARNVLFQKVFSRETIIDRLTLSHKADFGCNFNHPLIKSAKFLKIMYSVQQEDLLRVFNSRAYFSYVAITPVFVWVFIQNWISKKYPIGRRFAIGVKSRWAQRRLRTALERQPNVRMVHHARGWYGSSYIFSMGINTDLIAYFSASKSDDGDDITFHLTVHPKGHA